MNFWIRGTVRVVSSAAVIVSVMLVGMSASWAQQQAANVDGVKAASKAFYAALAVIDDGTAMDNVVEWCGSVDHDAVARDLFILVGDQGFHSAHRPDVMPG